MFNREENPGDVYEVACTMQALIDTPSNNCVMFEWNIR